MTSIRFQGGGLITGPAEKVQAALGQKSLEASAQQKPFASFESPYPDDNKYGRNQVLYVDGPDVEQAGTTYDDVFGYLHRNVVDTRVGVREHKLAGTLKATGEPFNRYDFSG